VSINVFTVHTGDLAVISSKSCAWCKILWDLHFKAYYFFCAKLYQKYLKRPSSEVVCIWKLQYL